MAKPYRSVWFNDERKWKMTKLADDVLQVGVHKAVGYIFNLNFEEPNSPHKEKHNLVKIEKLLLKQGKLVDIRPGQDGRITVMHAGDSSMMKSILDNNKELLRKSKWPVTPKAVLKKIATMDVKHDENAPLYHVICELFNSWCLWCEKSIWVVGMTEPQSAQPHDPDAVDG